MYIPKNRIKTNLYTNGEEYVYKNTPQFYTGFYWTSFDGKTYTGKTPNDKPSSQLEKYNNSTPTPSFPQLTSQIALTDGFYEGLDSKIYNDLIVTEYPIIRGSIKDVLDPSSTLRYLPTEQYPIPTSKDYDNGVFTRYFLTKSNEFLFLEVSKETFDKIKNKNPQWVWELYTPFILDWVLTGEKEQVYKSNKNTTLITEQRLKKKGISKYLKENYLKFYR